MIGESLREVRTGSGEERRVAPLEAGAERVLRSRVRTCSEVARSTSNRAVAAKRHVPEQRLPELDRSLLVADEPREVGWLGSGEVVQGRRKVGRQLCVRSQRYGANCHE